MGFILKVLLTGLAVFVADYILDGVHIAGDWVTTLIVALVLALLNTFLKPILVVLTIPITILTLGLFLLVINVVVIQMADWLIPGNLVQGFFNSLIFGFVLSIITSVLDMVLSSGRDD